MKPGSNSMQGAAEAARKIWIQMELPFLYEIIAESMWRAMEWVCDQRPNAVVASLKQVFRWRSSQWWHSTHAEGMRDDPMNHTGGNTNGSGMTDEMSGTKLPRTGLVKKIGSAAKKERQNFIR